KDVDGPTALPLRLDGEVSNLGKFAATRRVARTIYLGSAPMAGAANRGVEDRRIKPGCVMPREASAGLVDAPRRPRAPCHVPSSGRRPLLVLHAAHRHEVGGGPCRTAQTGS